VDFSLDYSKLRIKDQLLNNISSRELHDASLKSITFIDILINALINIMIHLILSAFIAYYGFFFVFDCKKMIISIILLRLCVLFLIFIVEHVKLLEEIIWLLVLFLLFFLLLFRMLLLLSDLRISKTLCLIIHLLLRKFIRYISSDKVNDRILSHCLLIIYQDLLDLLNWTLICLGICLSFFLKLLNCDYIIWVTDVIISLSNIVLFFDK